VRHADSPDGGLSIAVLGELGARIDGRVLDLGGRRQRAVLALLVLARGDVVPSDGLVDALWGAQASPTAVGALQAYVSNLRRQLEPGRAARSPGTVIVSEGPGYALRVDRDAVDAWRFERVVQQSSTLTEPAREVTALSAALALWRGPAFADYAGTPWVEAEAARLTALRALARERLLAARLSRGDSAVLVPEIEALVAEEPLREERWRLLVLALYRAHRQGEALAALRRARAVLAEELGVDPGPALRQLEADVLAQSPALQEPPRPASAVSVFDVAAEQSQPQPEGSLAVLHGLYWLTLNLTTERPLVLAIDDLQWCDSGSLRFLAYLVGRLQGVPVLIVATLRTGEPHANEALREPAVAAAAVARPAIRGGPAGRVARRHRDRDRVASRLQPGPHAAGPDAGREHHGGAGGRRARQRRRAAGRRGPGRPAGGRGGGRDRRTGPGRGAARRVPIEFRAPAGGRRRLSGPAARGAAVAARAGRPGAARGRCIGRAGRRPPAPCAAAR
jgi:DNA-binding SARP family transcriptional activator